jgi:hypothetical protein
MSTRSTIFAAEILDNAMDERSRAMPTASKSI